MAFTGTTIQKTVFGTLRIAIVSCTADALSGSVAAAGLGFIYAVGFAPVSMATAGVQIYINQNASGTASNGNVKVSGCASGDAFFLTVYGRS